jgi:ligand-binding sensor domain-containing protein
VRIALYVLLLLVSVRCFAQTNNTAGGYAIRHYGVKSFGMHPRNFFITQDKREVMYFGNAYGLLEYDAKNWRGINLPNGNSGLSLCLTAHDTMYVGGFNELGYLKPDTSGLLVYTSLYDKIPKAKQFNRDIQNILEAPEGVVFHSELGLHVFKNNTFKTVEPSVKGNLFTYIQKIQASIYVQEKGRGLSLLRNNQLELIPGGEVFKNHTIKEILPYSNQRLLIVTANAMFIFDQQSLTPLKGNANGILRQQQITHAIQQPDGNLLVTTYNNGFYMINASGDVIKHICIENGLPDNTINYAYIDKRGALWLALDNGIAYLEINTPFSFVGTDAGIQGMGYAAAVFDNKLYVGTSQGLYYTSAGEYTEKKFYPVKGIKGQIWNLSVMDNTLLCCQTDHTYQVTGDQAHLIAGSKDNEGHWKIAPLKGKPGYAIKGTYLGFQLYTLEKGQWKFSHKLEGFEESCRIFEEDEKGNIWVCHGNKGVYKVILSQDLARVASAENWSLLKGFKPDYFNFISIINHHLVFAADDGVFKLDESKQAFIKDTELEKIIGPDRFISRIVQYEDHNIWAFNWEDVNLYRFIATDQYKAQETVFKKIAGELVGSYEFILPVTTGLAIIGSQEGFTFFNLNETVEKNKNYQVLIRKVEANFKNDSLLYGGTELLKNLSPTLPYDFNGLRISYSAVFYENPEKISYQYALTTKGDAPLQWSGWTNNTQVDFSNLLEGSYVFHVRSKNIYEQLSEECIYSFRILPPWYRSWWAYTFYLIALVIGFLILYRYVRIRFHKQKEKLELQKQKELLILEQKHITENLQTEKELIALRNAKLEADMVLKNNELASLATTVTQKTEFLSQLKDKLEIIHKDPENTGQNVFKEVIKTIDQDLDFDDNWSKFQIHFDELHHNFLHRLREKYPKLNPSWLLLCAYIRMNKSNKEIAALMNISVSGVEKRKYRLREKLGMEGEDRLSDFIATF